jgi:hypothetical protein
MPPSGERRSLVVRGGQVDLVVVQVSPAQQDPEFPQSSEMADQLKRYYKHSVRGTTFTCHFGRRSFALLGMGDEAEGNGPSLLGQKPLIFGIRERPYLQRQSPINGRTGFWGT